MSRFRRRLMGLAQLREAKRKDFVRVEYIENSNLAYINTNFSISTNVGYSIDAVITISSAKAGYLIGKSGGNPYNASIGITATPNFKTFCNRTTVNYTDYTAELNKKYHLTGSPKNLTVEYEDIDEETQETVTKSFSFTNDGSIVNSKQLSIFNIIGYVNTSNAFYGRIYSFKLYNQSGTLVRDFIPMYQISTDTYGLWDRVNEEFYSSANSYKFTGGQRVIADNSDNLYYIKNYVSVNGNKYIDAQLKPNATDGWEADYYFTGTGRNYAWGAWSSSNSNSYGIRATASKIYFDYVTQAYVWSGTYGNKRMVIKADRNEFYINGVKKGQTTLQSGHAASRNFLIGNFNGSSYNGNGNLYWFKYWRNGELVRYYIPVQNVETKVYGLFDKVRNVCQYSSGSQALTGG